MPGPEDEGPAFDRRVRELFDRALSLPPAEREAFLLREAPDEPAVRARAAALLDKEADPTVHIAPELRQPPPSERPDRIGPYRILDQLGAGGMGTVYLAEQEQPVKRRAKILTLRFSPTLGRFDDAPLVSLQQKVVLEQLHEHLVEVGGESMLVCVSHWREQPQDNAPHLFEAQSGGSSRRWRATSEHSSRRPAAHF
ncbi:MAG: hypothetical protein H6835_03190 [Planctomycetes bacterium]|nr:hypothetical protein [Planctomycetota bacterium]